MRFIPNVYPDPLPRQLLGGDRRGGAAAEGVEHHIAFVAACFNDAAVERKRFLCGVAGNLLSSSWKPPRGAIERFYVRPGI